MFTGPDSKLGGIARNRLVYGSYRKAHSRESSILHRTWNLIFGLASIGLGIAIVFSCYSPQTKDVNIYTVQPLYFLRDFVANSTYATQGVQPLNYTATQNDSSPTQNDPFQNYPELQYNSSVNFSSLGLPELYYFGISGVCKKWTDSNTTCNRTFPPFLDIPLVILQDLKNTSNTSTLAADLASGNRQSYSAAAKAASALIITSLIWSVLTLALIQALPTEFIYQVIPLIIMVSLSLSAWAIYNEIFFTQAAYYSVNLKVLLRENNAIVLGPGFWVFIAYAFCTLFITPITAFWTVVFFLLLVMLSLVFLWLLWVLFLCALACIGAGGGGNTTTTTWGGDNGGFGGDGGDFGGD